MFAPLAVLAFALTAWYVIPFNMFDHSERLSVDTVIQLVASADAAAPTASPANYGAAGPLA